MDGGFEGNLGHHAANARAIGEGDAASHFPQSEEGVMRHWLSSALWFTAMAANPLGAEIARGHGLTIDFGSWLVASSVPTLAAMALLPLVLYKVVSPEITATPEAPRAARRALEAMGSLSLHEKIVAVTFAGMVALWGAAALSGLMGWWFGATVVEGIGINGLLALTAPPWGVRDPVFALDLSFYTFQLPLLEPLIDGHGRDLQSGGRACGNDSQSGHRNRQQTSRTLQ